MRQFALRDGLEGKYSVIMPAAYKAASMDHALEGDELQSIDDTIHRWVDRELELLDELPDMAEAKKKLADAFRVLVERRMAAGASRQMRLTHCPMCGGPLSDIFEDFMTRTCVDCVSPVQTALHALIRASTHLFTPEKILQNWHWVLEMYVEAGRDEP
ncbi:MAG: hypothetical protein JWR15_4235 [Prosthecobacter sp.]|nr:hypothetical protein [Prosthecobacter sp.]